MRCNRFSTQYTLEPDVSSINKHLFSLCTESILCFPLSTFLSAETGLVTPASQIAPIQSKQDDNNAFNKVNMVYERERKNCS